MNLPALSLPKIIPKISVGVGFSKYVGLAAPIGAIVVSLVVLALIVWPKFTQVLKLRNENAELATRVDNLEAKVSKLSSLDRDVLNSQLVAAEQLVPSDKGVFTVIRQVEGAAASSGVLLNKIEVVPGKVNAVASTPDGQAVGGVPSASPDSLVQLNISLSSDYRSFLQFTSNVLALPRAISVEDLSLSGGSGSEGSSQVRAAMTINAYWLPLPRELSSIESPVEDLTDSEKKLLEKGLATQPANSIIQQVPTGRTDLFAPF